MEAYTDLQLVVNGFYGAPPNDLENTMWDALTLHTPVSGKVVQRLYQIFNPVRNCPLRATDLKPMINEQIQKKETTT